MYDEDVFLEIELTCPICGHTYKSLKTKAKNPKNLATGMESYLLPIYEEELSNPLVYEIDSCPKCFYSAFHSDFKIKKGNVEKNIMLAFKGEIKELANEVPKEIYYRNYFVARQLYLLSAYIYEKNSIRDCNKLGKSYIRSAWFSKELKEIDFYKICLKKALDCFLELFSETEDMEKSAIIMYIISSLYYELGDFESAVPYLNKINGDLTAKKISMIKEPLENLTISIRKELKEIELRRKDMSDDEKKADKLKILESVKPKEYKEPLGSEIEKIDITNLKSDIVFEKKRTDKPIVMIMDSSKKQMKVIKLTIEEECEVIGVFNNWKDLEYKLKKEIPTIIIVDFSIEIESNLLAIKKIYKEYPDINFVGIGKDSSQKFIMKIFEYGISNYILRPIDRNKLITILKKS